MEMRPVGNIVYSAQEQAAARVEPPLAPAKAATPPPVPANAVSPPAASADIGQVTQAVNNINQTMQTLSQGLEFSVDTDSNRTIVKVIDPQTKEVIRQMPSAEALEIAKALDRVQGLLIKQKA